MRFLIKTLASLGTTLLLLGTSPVEAVECETYGEFIHDYPIGGLIQSPGSLVYLGPGLYEAGQVYAIGYGNDSTRLIVYDYELGYPSGEELLFVPDRGIGITEVALQDGIFLALSYGVLYVFDVSGTPTLLSVFDTGTGADELSWSGSIVYLADFRDVSAVDLSDPENPVLLGSFPLGNGGTLTSMGDYVYVADTSPTSLRVVDFSEPAVPIQVHEIEGIHVLALATDGTHLYATVFAPDHRILAFDLDDPAVPEPVGVVEFGVNAPPFNSLMKTHGQRLFVATDDAGWGLIDIADPSQPQFLGHFDGFRTQDFAFQGSFVFCYTTTGIGQIPGVRAWFLGDSAEPLPPLSSTSLPTAAVAVEVGGEVSYVILEDGSLHVLDVSDPTDPISLAIVAGISPAAVRAEAVGNALYISDSSLGLLHIDISNPSAPFLEGTLVGAGSFTGDLLVDGNRLWLASDDLILFDITDPTNPNLLATHPIAAGALVRRGNRLYTLRNLFAIYDVSDPLAPVLLGSRSTLEGSALLIKGNVAYTGTTLGFAAWTRKWDISTPSNISYLGKTWEFSLPERIVEEDGRYYMIDQGNGLQVGLIDPGAESDHFGYYGDPTLRDVCVDASGVYLATASGLVILPPECASVTAIDSDPSDSRTPRSAPLLLTGPSVSSGTVRLSLESDRAMGTIVITVLDVAGRVVERSWASLSNHRAEWTWDAGDSGIPVASGVYWVRAQNGGAIAVHRIILRQ